MRSIENAPAASSSNVDSGAIVKATYQFVAFDTRIKNAFPSEDVTSQDRLEITSEPSEVNAAILSSQANNNQAMTIGQSTSDSTQPVPKPSSGGSESGTHYPSFDDKPGVQCVANLYFQGLEATLLCLYNPAGSIASDFKIVDTNDAFKAGNMTRFEVGHNITHLLRSSVEMDHNGNPLLEVRFRFNKSSTEILGKKLGINQGQTKLTPDERSDLNTLF